MKKAGNFEPLLNLTTFVPVTVPPIAGRFYNKKHGLLVRVYFLVINFF